MTNALHSSIHQMAADFASLVLNAMRGATLDDILSETQAPGARRGSPAPVPARRGPGRPRREASAESAAESAPAAGPKGRRGGRSSRGGRLGRRSPGDIARVVGRIVDLLASHPAGLRAEQIRATLDLQAKELPRPITEALASRKIHKVGEKRATTYFASSGRGKAPATKAGRSDGNAAKRKAGRPAKKRSTRRAKASGGGESAKES